MGHNGALVQSELIDFQEGGWEAVPDRVWVPKHGGTPAGKASRARHGELAPARVI